MSRNQFAWLGESDDERGWFQDLAAKETTLDKPLCVSLDDIVLVRIEAGEQRPIDAQGVDLPIVFFHSFKEATGGAGGRDAATHSKEGIYKPGRTLAKAKALAKKAAERAKGGDMRLEKRRVAEDGKRTAARAKPTTEESKNHSEHSRRKEILAEGTKKEDEFSKAGTDAEVTTAGTDCCLHTQAMMRSNRQPRARHFWFAAEWVRDLLKTSANLNGVPLKVWHGGTYPNFTLPRHASRPMRCYANIPVAKAKVNGPNGGASCVYLYRFGKDKTTEDIRPAYFGGAAVDGAVIVTVRVYLRFCVQVGPDRHFVDDSGASQDLIDSFLPLLRSAVESDFNKKWIATGNFTTAENETINFTRCMVHFRARLLVANYGDPVTVEGLTGKKTSGDYANHVAAVRNTIAEHHTLEILPKFEAGQVTTFTGGGTNDLFFADASEDEMRADFSTFFRKSMGFTVSPVPLGELQTLVRSVFPNAVVALK